MNVQWIEEQVGVGRFRWLGELGAAVEPAKWKWRGNCYNACLDACLKERGGVDVPPLTDICAAQCYDASGCAALPYGTQQEYFAQTGHIGAFDQDMATCKTHEPNTNICHYLCMAARLAGWDENQFNICKNICITGACTQGILITPTAMQKVMAGSGACLSKCYADAAKLTDPTARAAANAACPSTCALAAELAKLPPTDKPSTKACPDGFIFVNGKGCKSVCPAGQELVGGFGGTCRPKAKPPTAASRASSVLPVLLVIGGVALLAAVARGAA